MSKYSPEFKEKLVREYHESDIGITSLANRHGLSAGMLQSWYQRYRVHGAQVFEKKYSVYSAKFKLSVLRHMTKNQLSYRETAAYFDASIKAAFALTHDAGIIDPNRLMITLLVPQLKLLIEAIDAMDKDIKARYKAQKDKAVFDSFPGAGPQLAPRLLVAFGSNSERYESAADMQKYAGVAPVIERSGKKSWTHWRYSCPKFIRQTFVEWAGQSVRFSFWAKAYYQQQIEKGKPHNTVIRALAFKWIRIVFSCWKTRTVYDESKYLETLKKRGSPLLQYAANS